MLNESILSLSTIDLKDLLFFKLTLLHIAFAYVLMYVIYKALGRYIYFKPQEHASKINRTFLSLSLLAVSINLLSSLIEYFPILPDYTWLFVVSGLVIIVAPLSIIADKLIWKYSNGKRQRRDWHYSYLPIPRDYFKTSISKSQRSDTSGVMHSIETWEEEGVESTRENIHSDALLSWLAVSIFIVVSGKWVYESAQYFGWQAYIFFLFLSLPISGLFIDRAIFSWIDYLESMPWKKRGR